MPDSFINSIAITLGSSFKKRGGDNKYKSEA
jgi:hypothetical protein